VGVAVFEVGGPQEIASAIDAAKAAGVEALNFLATPLFSAPGTQNNRVVMERVTTVRLPAIFQWPEIAEAGALAGYGPRITDTYRQRARMLVKIFHGTKPADIPVEQPARFELVINLKAAKAIGYEVPASLVLRADEGIEGSGASSPRCPAARPLGRSRRTRSSRRCRSSGSSTPIPRAAEKALDRLEKSLRFASGPLHRNVRKAQQQSGINGVSHRAGG